MQRIAGSLQETHTPHPWMRRPIGRAVLASDAQRAGGGADCEFVPPTLLTDQTVPRSEPEHATAGCHMFRRKKRLNWVHRPLGY
jgi:hypothetical protein